MKRANLLSFGTSFSGKANEKAKDMFKTKDETKSLGELTDYTVLDQYQVNVTGDSPPQPIDDWSSFSQNLQNSLLEAGFTKPTPAQRYSIPCFFASRPFITISPTGSGKTLAYALPLLQLLENFPHNELKCIVLVPTRELASQIFRQFRRFSESSATRVQLLRKNRDTPKCQILITTPKRLLIAKPNLDNVTHIVIDEADHLLSHSFVQQTDQVLSLLQNPSAPKNEGEDQGEKEPSTKPAPRNIHVSLFSATMNPKVEESARSFMTNPIRIQVGDNHAVAALITQELKFVGREKGKVLEIRQRLNSGQIELPVIIFVQNKQRAYDLFNELGLPASILTADQNDAQRAEAIRKVRTGDHQFLITTDLAGRGIDLAAIKSVINFDLPPDSTTYIHRIGRTARAGRAGHALTFFTEDDMPNLKPVASVMKKAGFHVEDWMLRNPDKQHRGARALFEPTKRHTISSRLWKNAKIRNPEPKVQPNVE